MTISLSDQERKQAENKITQNVILRKLTTKYPHVLDYLINNYDEDIGIPVYIDKLERKHGKIDHPNILYPAEGPVQIWIYPGKKGRTIYAPIEPTLDTKTDTATQKIMDMLTSMISQDDIPESKEDHIKLYDNFAKRIIRTNIQGRSLNPSQNPAQNQQAGNQNFVKKFIEKFTSKSKISLDPVVAERVRYYFIRNKIGLGKLQPLINDPYIEDITCNGKGPLFVEHKIFESLESKIIFESDEELDLFALYLSERSGRPASHANPVVDAALPDGSRINIVYGTDVSMHGSNFTIRKFSESVISVVNLIGWKTMSSQLCAYLWMVLSSHHSMMVVGETASGKTTSLNALLTFIDPNAKIVSIEDTPEVKVPHQNWTREVTRPASAGNPVDIFLLVKAALRQRPNLIIIGEIRGEEGNMAFQAMQTGHPMVATFHAGSVRAFVNRMTGKPINVPPAFIALLDLVYIQMAVQGKSGKMLRRCITCNELVDYLPKKDKFRYVELFAWDAGDDSHIFRNQSYVFEEKIAKKRGIKRKDIRLLYDELRTKRHILEAMAELGISNYYTIFRILTKYRNNGKLPQEIVDTMKRRMKEEDDAAL
ncbi:MAG: type II/IV secretion system ATPase subunit [Promethearchaeota archaeon]